MSCAHRVLLVTTDVVLTSSVVHTIADLCRLTRVDLRSLSSVGIASFLFFLQPRLIGLRSVYQSIKVVKLLLVLLVQETARK